MATSRWALPIMVIYSLVLWSVYLIAEPMLLPSLILFSMSTYLMIELNNRNALMRQYSRMVSCSYIAVMMMCPWILQNIKIMTVQLCVLIAYSLLFSTYQKRGDMGHKFWAYVFLGVGAFIWPPLLFVVPLFWIGEAFYLMSFSFKAFWASIFGILTPLWIAVPALFYTDRLQSEYERIKNAFIPGDRLIAGLHDVSVLVQEDLLIDKYQLAVSVFIVILLVVGIVHYFRQSYADKIHVRMLYQFFTMTTLALLAAFVIVGLLPFNNDPSTYVLFALILIGFAPLTAHYITFSSSRISNISVIIMMIIAFVCAVAQAALPYVDPATLDTLTP